MKKIMALIVAAILILPFSACTNNAIDYGYGKEESRFTANINQRWEDDGVDDFLNETGNTQAALGEIKTKMMQFYGENQEISGNYNNALSALTPYGTYVGKLDTNNILSWKGIPYAKAPIKDLRWKAPQKLDNSNKVYEAYYFGHSSIQIETKDEPAAMYPQGEDCLNINIWNNKNDNTTNKPIMLWIHGGAYICGGAVSPEYEGTNFVKNNPNVIYASLDYRTSFLGFINLSEVPGGEKYKESANLGLLDEIAALAWLKENAESFGGDPDKITIFGESAGGGSVSALTVIPQAKGLFKRAIIQSGSTTNFLRTAEKSKSLTQQILDITGAETMNDLLELTESDLCKVATILAIQGTSTYTYPQLDGITLPLDIQSKLYDDTRDGIEILSGTTKDEYEYWTYIMTPEYNSEMMDESIAMFTDKMNPIELNRWNKFKEGLEGSEYKQKIEAINYLGFHAPCRFEAMTHAQNGQKVYQYFFTEGYNDTYTDPVTQQESPYGSFHAQELQFLFGNFDPDKYLCCSHDEAVRLSNIMQKMWVNFAISGDPSIAEGDVDGVSPITWNPYTLEHNNVMILNAQECKQVDDPLKENIDLIGDAFWLKLK